METIYGVHMTSFPPALAMVGDDWLVRGTVSHKRDFEFFVWETILADLRPVNIMAKWFNSCAVCISDHFWMTDDQKKLFWSYVMLLTSGYL